MTDTAARHASAPGVIRTAAAILVLLVIVNMAPPHASAADDVLITRDVPYGTSQQEQLKLDVYQPPVSASSAAVHPVMLLIHGGGWFSGDKEDYAPVSHMLAKAGFVVFDINYSLDLTSPAYPRQVTDVHTALAWVQEHAEEFRGDRDRIGVAGGSAGGYLAAMLGTQANARSSSAVRAVVSLSGPMDVSSLVAELRQAVRLPSGVCAPVDCDVLDAASERLRILLGCDPLQCSEQLADEASPVTYVTERSPAFFLANGTQEKVPASQATLMAEALRSRDVPVDVQLVPGDGHGIAYVPAIRGALLAFLTTHVVNSSPGNGPAAPTGEEPEQPREGRRLMALLPWAVAVAALSALVVMVAVRRRGLGSADSDVRHLLEDLGEPVDQGKRSP